MSSKRSIWSSDQPAFFANGKKYALNPELHNYRLDGNQLPIHGLVNYSSEEASRLIGQPTHKIEEILGYVDEPEMIHRDNLIVA